MKFHQFYLFVAHEHEHACRTTCRLFCVLNLNRAVLIAFGVHYTANEKKISKNKPFDEVNGEGRKYSPGKGTDINQKTRIITRQKLSRLYRNYH